MNQDIDDGQMDAGYSEESTPAEMPEQVEEKQPVAEVKPEAIDPMKELMDRFEKLEHRTRNAEGHIGGLNHKQKLLDETVQAAKAATEQVRAAPSQAQVNEAIENPAEWNALKDDFPEWATATEKYMDAKLAAAKPQPFDMSPIDKLVNERIASQSESMKQTLSIVALDTAFPDWQEEVKTPEFAKWQSAQSEAVQKLGESDNAADASRMLRLYEASKRQTSNNEVKPEISTRMKRLEAAVNPRGTGGSNRASSTELDEMEAGYR